MKYVFVTAIKGDRNQLSLDIRIKCAFVTANQVAHVNCGNCRMLLMYQYGARSVKCAVCNFVTSVGVSTLFILAQWMLAEVMSFCCVSSYIN